MRKINVLFVIIEMSRGGSEQLVLNIVRNLDRTRFSPSIAWFYGDTVLEEFTELQVPLYHVAKRKNIDFDTMQQFASILKDNDIDVVNAHHFMSAVYTYYGCKIKKLARLVYTEHSEWEIEVASWKWRILGSLLLRSIDRTVGVSKAVKSCLERKYFTPSAKITTIENGVDISRYTESQGIDGLKKAIGINADEKIIGIVAHLKRVKNHLFLLNAFKELRSDLEKVKLVLVGQGFENDPENTEELIRGYIADNHLGNDVLLLGFRSDVNRIMSIMDVFCMTSNMEGLPISLIEAMAAGLPVVGTNVPGIRSVITHERSGFLIEKGDVEGLKNALFDVLTDENLRQSMGKEAKADAELYSMESCIQKYENLFSDIHLNKQC